MALSDEMIEIRQIDKIIGNYQLSVIHTSLTELSLSINRAHYKIKSELIQLHH